MFGYGFLNSALTKMRYNGTESKVGVGDFVTTRRERTGMVGYLKSEDLEAKRELDDVRREMDLLTRRASVMTPKNWTGAIVNVQ